MRIFLMTDLEGVSGVLDFNGWCEQTSPFFEDARRLLTLEANAAIEGFYSAGATSVLVVDGHGAGGINPELLDRRTLFLRGFPGPFPYGLDRGFDAVAWVGQHAKAGAEYAHIPHTHRFAVKEYSINGAPVGELGCMAMCGAFIGVPSIFASGDEALCREARELIPEIETASVKRGLTPGSGAELDAESYKARNTAALHLHPEKARELVRIGAATALTRLRENRGAFPLIHVEAPFERRVTYRRDGETPGYSAKARHATDLVAALNTAEKRERSK
jgi:D-amino peptidase